MTLSEYDRQHIGDILNGHGTWFTAHLLRLLPRADAGNLAKLERAFPEVVEAYREWRRGEHD